MSSQLPPFRLEAYFSRWEFTARHQMCASDVEALTLEELLAMAEPADRAAWESLKLGYTPPRGSPELRDAIAATYDRVGAAGVMCFAGAEEAIYAAMHALLRPTDHAIAVLPCYQSLESVPQAICETTGVALDPERDWDLDLDRVRRAIRSNTRLIALNFPHNPTGKIIPRATLDGLVALAREHGLFLLNDEVYRGVERVPEARLPQVADVYERGVSIGVLSKVYGLPGLRIAWAACRDAEALDRMETVRHYLSICSAAPSEALATIALKARERLLERSRALIEANLPKLNRFFARRPERFEWAVPDGGCIGYPRYLGTEGVERFAQALVEDSGVFLLPASVYRSTLGPAPSDRFRIGYGRADLDEGLAALEAHLTRGPDRRPGS